MTISNSIIANMLSWVDKNEILLLLRNAVEFRSGSGSDSWRNYFARKPEVISKSGLRLKGWKLKGWSKWKVLEHNYP